MTIFDYISGLIADPLRELLVRLSKRGLPTPEESALDFETAEKKRVRDVKEAAKDVIREGLK